MWEKLAKILVTPLLYILFLPRLRRILGRVRRIELVRPFLSREQLIRSGISFDPRSFVSNAGSGLLDNVKLFVDAGIDINIADDKGERALIVAARQGRTDVVCFLVGLKGIKVNADNSVKDTPLIVAARSKDREIVEILFAHPDTDLNIRNEKDEDAWIAAINSGAEEIEGLFADPKREADDRGVLELKTRLHLEKHGRFNANAFVEQCSLGRLEEVRGFLIAGMDVNVRNDQGQAALLAAASIPDPEIVARLLEEANVEVNITDKKSGNTPLILATIANGFEVVRQLLGHASIKVNLANDAGETALLIAAREGFENIVTELERKGAKEEDLSRKIARWKLERSTLSLTEQTFFDMVELKRLPEIELLIEAGIAVNCQDEEGNTALLLAANNGDLSIVEFLLEDSRPTDINATNDKGDTSLIVAARRNHLDVVKHLLKKKSDVTLRNNEDESALLAAARRDFSTVADVLKTKGKANEPELEKNVARWQLERDKVWSHKEFIDAVWHNNETLVKKFLRAGMSVNARDETRETALIAATRNGKEEMVKLLLQQPGIDVEARNASSSTALDIALSKKLDGIVKLLLKKNAKRDEKGVVQWSIREAGLVYATRVFVSMAEQGQLEKVEDFLKSGMHPNAEDDSGRVALIEAARNGHKAVVEMLLGAGAHANRADRFGVTAREVAELNGYHDIAELLAKAGGQSTEPAKNELIVALDSGNVDALSAAIASGASADAYTDTGKPALVQTVLSQRNDVLTELLNNGARAGARDRDGMTALMHAAELGYVEAIRILLNRKDPGIDYTDLEGRTALILAAWQGRTTAVKILIEAGANPNIRDQKNRTALIAAATGGHNAIVEMLKSTGVAEEVDGSQLLLAATRGEDDRLVELVSKSASAIEIPDREGNTPLALAAARGWTRSIQTLLDAHADANTANNNGDTPVMLAARAGRVEAVKQLLNHNDARVLANATNNNGETPLLQAAIAGRGLVVELLAGYSDEPDLGANGRTPLVEMCYHGDPRAVAALIGVRSDVNQQQVTLGKSPLMTAMLAGHTEIVQMLKDNGARAGEAEAQMFLIAKSGDDEALRNMSLDKIDLNARDANGWTALMVAASEGHDGVVKLLLDNQANADLMAPDGRETALRLAASKGRAGSLALLIAKTTRSKASDSLALIEAATAGHAQAIRLLVQSAHAPVDGLEGRRVPLVEAASRGHLQAVKVLLELNADPQRETRQGMTALRAAYLNNRDAVVEYLQEHGAQQDDDSGLADVQLIIAAAKPDVAEVERLLMLPVPPRLNARDDRGRTALMRACEKRAEAVVELLLGAHDSKNLPLAIMERDFALRTPLMWAAIGGSPAIVERLLRLNADVSAEAKKKRTALLEACKSGRLRSVELLLNKLETPEEREVAVNHQDDDGHSPLTEALSEFHGRSYEYAKIVALLERHGAVQGRAQAEFLKAVQACDLATVQRRFPEIDLNKLRHKHKTPLMLAVESGCKDVVAFLINKFADVDERGPGGATALILAASKTSVTANDEEIVRLLLRYHADYDWTDQEESSALLYAISGEHERIVKDLIDEGANINQRDRTGATALSIAVERNNPRLVRLLLSSKRKLETEVWTGAHRTALTLARLRGRKTGVDETSLSAAGQPLPPPVAAKLSEIETMLVQAHAREGWNEAELILAIGEGDIKWARQLLTKASVHTQDLQGNTPLFLACSKNEISLARALLKHGASPGVRNNAERTPLMEATKNRNFELVEELLNVDNSLDLDAQDADGESALLEAARVGAGDIVTLLMDHGANVEVTNRSLSTPLIEIARHAQPQAVRALLAHGVNACARTASHRTAVIEAAAAGQLDVLKILLDHLDGRLANEHDKFLIVINAVDNDSHTAFDWANEGSHSKCVKLLDAHGAKSVGDTAHVVFTTPHGGSYHRLGCPHLGSPGKKKLTRRLLRVALRKGYDLCRDCKPGQSSIDWNCS